MDNEQKKAFVKITSKLLAACNFKWQKSCLEKDDHLIMNNSRDHFTNEDEVLSSVLCMLAWIAVIQLSTERLLPSIFRDLSPLSVSSRKSLCILVIVSSFGSLELKESDNNWLIWLNFICDKTI